MCSRTHKDLQKHVAQQIFCGIKTLLRYCMAALISVLNAFWYADLCFLLAVLARFAQLGVYRRYSALTLFFFFDLLGSMTGLTIGVSAVFYYWTAFVINVVLGIFLLLWMGREMFAELYFSYAGLSGATQYTLKRSIIISFFVTLSLAPVAIIHWNEYGFRCWQFPVIEVRRCLNFGLVMFIVLMWNMLRWLPVQIPENVRTYSYSMCLYLALGGLIQTIILIKHTFTTGLICNIVLLLLQIALHIALAIRIQRPDPIDYGPRFCPVPSDPDLISRLSSVSNFLDRVSDAQLRGGASALNRLGLLAVTSWFKEPKPISPIYWSLVGIWNDLAERLRYALRALRSW